MKSNVFLYVAAGGTLLYLLTRSNTANGATNNTMIDLSGLADSYGSQNVIALQNLLNVLEQNNLTPLQMRLMGAQALQETGLFTSAPNWHAVTTLNNYAGISNSDGSLKGYPNIQAFVNEWIPILSKNNDPIDQSNVADFNTALKSNGYYTDSATTYGNNLNYYFNLLNQ